MKKMFRGISLLLLASFLAATSASMANDQSHRMTGMDHSKMRGMDHSKMKGMTHSKMRVQSKAVHIERKRKAQIKKEVKVRKRLVRH